MSFSSNIKQELNKNSNLANKKIVKQELIGYLISGNAVISNNKEIKFSTESDYNINRYSKLLSNLNINHKIEISRKNIYYNTKNKRYQFCHNRKWQNIFKIRRKIKRRGDKSFN